MPKKNSKTNQSFNDRDLYDERAPKQPKTKSVYQPQLVKKTNNKRIWDRVLGEADNDQ